MAAGGAGRDEQFMDLAVEVARQGIEAGQTPFGAVIVLDGRVVAASYNTVWRDVDPTAHAEINGLRHASGSLKSIDLSGGSIYTTCEPCPMCLAAIHWAKLDRVVFGAAIEDAAAAGFRELRISARKMVELGGLSLQVVSGVRRAECARLFELWHAQGRSGAY
jgi:tRNA(Arg) A34 adenosine deaminase TadA